MVPSEHTNPTSYITIGGALTGIFTAVDIALKYLFIDLNTETIIPWQCHLFLDMT